MGIATQTLTNAAGVINDCIMAFTTDAVAAADTVFNFGFKPRMVRFVNLTDRLTSEVVEGIAKLKDKLDPETTQVVFKDAGFADSNVKTNAIQILKQAGVDDVKSI